MDQTQQNPQNQTGMPGGAPQEEKSVGALIGSIIIIVIIVIGGIYFWATQEKMMPSDTSTQMQNMMGDQSTNMLLEQGTSDNLSDIEADLNATNLDNLDAELSDIDGQL